MTYTTLSIPDFLANTSPFDQLSPQLRERLSAKFQPLRYRMGQAILVRETMPDSIAILYEGQARLLGYASPTQAPVTLQLLNPGDILGWASLVRGVACETVIASTAALCLTLKAADFLALLQLEPAIDTAFRDRCALIEVFDLLGAELSRQAHGVVNLKDLAISAAQEAVVLNLPPGKTPRQQLDPNFLWLVSGGTVTNLVVGSRLTLEDSASIQVEGPGSARLLGLRFPTQLLPDSTATMTSKAVTASLDIPYAPDRPFEPEPTQSQTRSTKYPYVHGRGPREAALACFQMLSQHLGLPSRRDVLNRALANQLQRHGSISLQFCGAIAELMGLSSQLVKVPAVAVSRLQAPALLGWQDSFALLYSASETELVLAIPESGIRRLKPAAFIAAWDTEGEFLLLQPTKDTPQQRFGLSWFLPSLYRYRKVLL